MKTYFLSIPANAKLLYDQAKRGAVFAQRKTDRAVVVTEPENLPEYVMVVKSIAGDRRAEGLQWIERNVLDELAADFVTKEHLRSESDRAVRAVWRAKERKAQAEARAATVREEIPAFRLRRAALEARLDKEFQRIDKRHKAALEKLRFAEAGEYDASARAVRACGRGNIVIDGETYDASFRGETVFYIRRAGWGKRVTGKKERKK